MAKISTLAKNEKKVKLAQRYEAKRAELRKIVKDPNAGDEEKYDAVVRLQKFPRNSARERVRNRCVVSGRSRGHLRAFGLSRIAFRELALRGMIPGVTKSSW